uniref:Uncharacterized protein n=1 Tax=Oryza sativa subsp. japonica TaxID=39947 RepID=Q10K05_ORYSJ|nr:hypothetical protein LOC_Os03g28360 [Oryza sativa Japonica Group]
MATGGGDELGDAGGDDDANRRQRRCEPDDNDDGAGGDSRVGGRRRLAGGGSQREPSAQRQAGRISANGPGADLVPPWWLSRSPHRRGRYLSANHFGAEVPNLSAKIVGANIGYLEPDRGRPSQFSLYSSPAARLGFGRHRVLLAESPLKTSLIEGDLCGIELGIDREDESTHGSQFEEMTVRQLVFFAKPTFEELMSRIKHELDWSDELEELFEEDVDVGEGVHGGEDVEVREEVHGEENMPVREEVCVEGNVPLREEVHAEDNVPLREEVNVEEVRERVNGEEDVEVRAEGHVKDGREVGEDEELSDVKANAKDVSMGFRELVRTKLYSRQDCEKAMISSGLNPGWLGRDS